MIYYFNNNEGIGGFEQLVFRTPVVQPIESNWTRQLAQDIPKEPKMRKVITMNDFRIDNDNCDSFIVLSPDEVLLVDSNNFYISPRYSRLISVRNSGKVEVLYDDSRIDQLILMTPVMNINGDTILASSYSSNSENYSLFCLSPQYEVKWQYEFNTPPYKNPVIDELGNIYVYTLNQSIDDINSMNDGKLYCIDKEGKLLWRQELGGYIWHEPIINKDGHIFIGVQNKGLILDKYGKKLNSFNLLGNDRSIPVIDKNGTMYINENAGISAITLQGEPLWTYKIPLKAIYTNPSISRYGDLYFSTNYDEIGCVDINGKSKWLTSVKGQIDKPPIIGKNGILCSFGFELCRKYEISYIHILSEGGRLLWESEPINGSIKSILPSGDGRLYVLVSMVNFKVTGNKYKCYWELYEIS